MTSIVRRGNHFIQLDGQWCLIDGPWFEYLKRLSNGSMVPVRLAYYDSGDDWPQYRILDVDEIYGRFLDNNTSIVEWEPRMWHPGFTTPWCRPWVSFGELWLRDRWHNWNDKRKRMGFVLLPDGKLPEFLAGPMINGTESDYWWYNAWDQYD